MDKFVFDIKEIGAICKYYRIKVLYLSLTEFAKRNNEKIQNIHAFEQGRANNIKYLYMYMKQSSIYQLDILMYNLFYDLLGIKEE